MVGGFVVFLSLCVVGFVHHEGTRPYELLGLDPFIWGFLASLLFAWIGTRLSAPPRNGKKE